MWTGLLSRPTRDSDERVMAAPVAGLFFLLHPFFSPCAEVGDCGHIVVADAIEVHIQVYHRLFS